VYIMTVPMRSNSKTSSGNVLVIPPQGKRTKPIKISCTFAEPDKERDEEIDRLILKTVFGI